MATIEEDDFTSDSGLFTKYETNGTVTIGGGSMDIRKTSGSAWNQTGFTTAAFKEVSYGHTFEIQFELDDPHSGGNYFRLGLKTGNGGGGPVLTNNAAIDCYVYTDGGIMKAHGVGSGVGVSSTPSEAMTQGNTYTLSVHFTNPEGHIEIKIKGGTWGDTYQDLVIDSAGSSDIDAVTNWTDHWILGQAWSPSADFSLKNYHYFDDTTAASGGSSGSKIVRAVRRNFWKK